ncbi:MAG: hypothetical protein E7081_03305 [Bacteroidales bacterium]|nr:hypothetical protein [Bacteroidales bacterium]
MKHIFAIILSIMLLTACGESERVQFGQLQQIDSIAEVNVDSAIVLLNAINRDSLSSNDNKYYFDLLQIRASDKAYIAHTSDSAILSVINYFENHDFNNLLPIAYYYGGRVYSDLGDAPQALEYFQKALDCESTNTNLLLNGKISSQMGQLMIKTQLYHQAKYKFKEAISYNIKSNDSLALMFNYSNLGSAYKWVEKPDSSIYFIKKAIDIATQKNINNEYKMLMHCHIASVYAYKKDFIRAKIELEKCISFFYTPKNQIYAYCIACNIYIAI